IAEHLERAVLPLRDALDQLRRRVHRVRLRIFQVGAGRERATALVAGEDGAPDVVVLLHGVEVTLDPLVEVGAPGVARRRAAERDDADVIALLVLDRHVGVLSGPPRATSSLSASLRAPALPAPSTSQNLAQSRWGDRGERRRSPRLMNSPGALARGTADPDASGHAHALDVGGAARMHGDDPVALLQLEEAVDRAPRGIGGERGRADGFQDRAGHPEAGHLPVVGELRALVGARAPGVRQPEVAQAEEPLDLRPDIDVGEQVARVRILAERDAVALGL